MAKREEDQGARLIRCGMGVLLGGVLGVALCCLFLLGCAAAVSGGLAGEELGYQFTVVGCVLGGFGGGVLAVKRCGGGLLTGLGTGAVFFLLLLTAGALFYQSVTVRAGGAGLLCGALCGGAAAGLLSGGRGTKTPRKKRRKR